MRPWFSHLDAPATLVVERPEAAPQEPLALPGSSCSCIRSSGTRTTVWGLRNDPRKRDPVGLDCARAGSPRPAQEGGDEEEDTGPELQETGFHAALGADTFPSSHDGATLAEAKDKPARLKSRNSIRQVDRAMNERRP